MSRLVDIIAAAKRSGEVMRPVAAVPYARAMGVSAVTVETSESDITRAHPAGAPVVF